MRCGAGGIAARSTHILLHSIARASRSHQIHARLACCLQSKEADKPPSPAEEKEDEDDDEDDEEEKEEPAAEAKDEL